MRTNGFYCVAECKINQSITSAGATNNNILEITKHDDFSPNSNSMSIWQAYNVGEGMKIGGESCDENIYGCQRIFDKYIQQ